MNIFFVLKLVGLWRQTSPFRVGADGPLRLPQPTEGGPSLDGIRCPLPSQAADKYSCAQH